MPRCRPPHFLSLPTRSHRSARLSRARLRRQRARVRAQARQAPHTSATGDCSATCSGSSRRRSCSWCARAPPTATRARRRSRTRSSTGTRSSPRRSRRRDLRLRAYRKPAGLRLRLLLVRFWVAPRQLLLRLQVFLQCLHRWRFCRLQRLRAARLRRLLLLLLLLLLRSP